MFCTRCWWRGRDCRSCNIEVPCWLEGELTRQEEKEGQRNLTLLLLIFFFVYRMQTFLYRSDVVLYRLMMLSVHLSESGDNARDRLVWAAPTLLKSSYPYMQWPSLTEFIHRPGSITSLYTFPLEYTNLTTHKNTEYTLYKVTSNKSIQAWCRHTCHQHETSPPRHPHYTHLNSLIGASESLRVATILAPCILLMKSHLPTMSC